MSNPLDFAKLIAPITIETFFQNYWEKNFLHLQRENASYYDSVLQVKSLDVYLQSQQFNPDFYHVTKLGQPVPMEDWTDSLNPYGKPLRKVNIHKLLSLFADGATIIVTGGHYSIPSLAAFCANFERELQFRIQANTYVTPPNSQGFEAHIDGHDVIILQISGSKRWRVYQSEKHNLPVDTSTYQKTDDMAETDVYDFDMHAGDFLYLPRGFAHEVFTTDEHSIHITVGLLPKYWFNLVQDIATVAKDERAFRQALPHGFASDEEREAFAEVFKQNLLELIENVDVKALLKQQMQTFVANKLQFQDNPLTDVLHLPDLSLDTVVAKNPTISYIVQHKAKQIIVSYGDHEVSLPTYLDSVLDTIVQDAPFAIGDIEGLLTDQGKIDLVKKLIRTGFVGLVHDE